MPGESVMVGQLMSIVYDWLPEQPKPSVAVIVNVKVPVVVGVPDNTPVVALMLTPAGNAPEVLHVIVPVLPVCVAVWLYAVFTVPSGNVAGATVMVGQLMSIVYVWVPEQPMPSVAMIVKVYVPVVVGVPESTPVEELIVIPGGSVPEVLHVIVPVPPVCVAVWL